MENPIDMDDLGYPHVRKPPNGLAIDSFSKEFLNQKKNVGCTSGIITGADMCRGPATSEVCAETPGSGLCAGKGEGRTAATSL